MAKLINYSKNANVFTNGEHIYYFSYETCVGYERHGATGDSVRVRLKNRWSNTTGRHINKMGIKDFPIVDEDEFQAIVAGSFK